MNVLRDEVYGERAALPILEQTRALHRYMETIINQRECLRTHVASVKAYTLNLHHLKLKNGDHGPFSAAEITKLIQRLDDIQRYLEHHLLTSETTVKSMENLLGLVSPHSHLHSINRAINLSFQRRPKKDMTDCIFIGIQHRSRISGTSSKAIKLSRFGISSTEFCSRKSIAYQFAGLY